MFPVEKDFYCGGKEEQDPAENINFATLRSRYNVIHQNKMEQNLRSSNGNCPCTFLKPAITKSIVEERRIGSRAGFDASASQNCDGDERGTKDQIQQDTKDGEERDSSEKAD